MMDDQETPAERGATDAPHPGSERMPRWGTAELIEAPRFTRRNWFALLGPGLVMGAGAMGHGSMQGHGTMPMKKQ